MADDQATFAERFTGEPAAAPPPEPALLDRSQTFASYEYAAKYAKQQYDKGNYGRFAAGVLAAIPAGLVDGIASLFTQSSKAYHEGLTPGEEVEFSVNAGLTQIGGGEEFRLPKGAQSAFDQFHEQVVKPVAQSMVGTPGTPDPPRIVVPLSPENVSPQFPPPGVPRSQLALTGEPHIDAVLNARTTKSVIDNPVVDRAHDVPYGAGGSVPLEKPITYIDKDFPRSFSIDGRAFDPADPFIVHENTEQTVMGLLEDAGWDKQTAYRVAHFEFAEKAEGAWYKAHGIDQARAEAAYKPYLDAIQRKEATNVPADLYKDPYPHDSPFAAQHEALGESRPTPEEIERAKKVIADWQAKGSPEPEPEKPPTVNPIQQAKELGVIGGDRPDLIGVPPKEAGRRAMAATAKPGEKVTGEIEGSSAWRQRFERTLDKMETPADARRVIGAIVDRNDEFQAARQGDLSPAQVEQLGVVAGLDTTKIDVAGTSAKIKTNAQMRNVIEAFTSLNAKIKEAADAVRAKNGLADDAEVAEMQRLELQRDLLLDATTSTKEFVALRAEFGRLGNVIQEFMKSQADANEFRKFMRDRLGNSIDDVRDRARKIADTDDRALPRALNPSARVKAMPWQFWLWNNFLISGLITHTKYAIVNTAQTALDRVFAPEVAALIERAKGNKNASLAAPVWGFASMIHAFPDAIRGSWQALKTGDRVPLISEMELAERGEESPEAGAQATPYQTGNKVNWGIWKRVFNEDQLAKVQMVSGTPGKSANALHTFYKILNERASLGSRAYQEAFAERPSSNAEFWQRYEQHYANPSDENLRGAVADGYSGTFMEKLGPETQRLASALKGNPLTRWLFPFMHIPLNIAKSAIGYSPLAAFGPEMRADLMGRNGSAAQSLALSKVVIGTSAIAYFATRAFNDQMTGSYPIDAKERQRWKLLGMQPNSVSVDGEWHSMDRLGPIGILAGYAADLVHVWQHFDVEKDGADKAIAKAVAGLGIAFANSIANDVGFQSMRNIIDVLDGQQKPERFLSYQASTFAIPSLVRQAASFSDPYMREAGSLIDGLKYAIPFAREGLLPKRDPLYGAPVANPGYQTVGRGVPLDSDFAKSELDRIGYYPTAPSHKIGGATLTPEQYDKFEATAGPLVKAALDGMVRSPQWQAHQNNPAWQTTVAKQIIKEARAKAAGAMQADDHSIIEAGRQRRLGQINGH